MGIFCHFHSKYEKCKKLVFDYQANETKLVEELEFRKQQMEMAEQRYDKLKDHAMKQLDKWVVVAASSALCSISWKKKQKLCNFEPNTKSIYSANDMLESLTKTHTNESLRLSAQLRREEISRQSLMDQLAQKTKENEELVKICDELINNGGNWGKT